jgi:hypothetical protein
MRGALGIAALIERQLQPETAPANTSGKAP